MRKDPGATPARLRRLADELVDEGYGFIEHDRPLLLPELYYALRPAVHERRAPSFGSFVAPTVDPSEWSGPTELTISRSPVENLPVHQARRFADGLSSWLVRREESTELVVFDRPAGSERDLVVLAESTGASIVQRHPGGAVRAVGSFGVLRWDGIGWHHEPPVRSWLDTLGAGGLHGDTKVLGKLMAFAVHDLGARGTGALLVYRPGDDGADGADDADDATWELRLPVPPPLHIARPADLAPLRHVLSQIDGAAVFDRTGTLRQLGVRLIPSAEAIADVEGYRGMRHTSGRRYSFDEPDATVIVVSEDGPVTVLRNGELIGRSEPT